ncbi:hypothetical protein [Asticcacaulis sp. YBE204]|uniref:hypothetical protein n=1 Tax=Asticcacaulis sp. YBE204 TaxID=1282363 RepID=UPI0012DE9FAA|nr:hypothetical protein [Asticcacaulis sp. YBE204]
MRDQVSFSQGAKPKSRNWGRDIALGLGIGVAVSACGFGGDDAAQARLYRHAGRSRLNRTLSLIDIRSVFIHKARLSIRALSLPENTLIFCCRAFDSKTARTVFWHFLECARKA